MVRNWEIIEPATVWRQRGKGRVLAQGGVVNTIDIMSVKGAKCTIMQNAVSDSGSKEI